jgi:hypothetical protein
MWHRSLALQQICNFDPSKINPLKHALAVTVDNFIGSRWLLSHLHYVQSVHKVICPLSLILRATLHAGPKWVPAQIVQISTNRIARNC